MQFKKLKTPLGEEDIKKLKLKDIVYISGTIFTARDRAHKRIIEFLKERKKLPFNLQNAVIFHSGPLIKKINGEWKIFGIGPTTSARMNSFAEKIIKRFKIRAIIGKGGMSNEVINAMKNHCVYFAMTGGCSALATKNVKKIKNIFWEKDLSLPEAVFELEVENLGPLIVAIDSKGNSLY